MHCTEKILTVAQSKDRQAGYLKHDATLCQVTTDHMDHIVYPAVYSVYINQT